MTEINRAIPAAVTGKQRLAVDERNVAVSRAHSVFIRLTDDGAALDIVMVHPRIKVAAGKHEDRELRMRIADNPEKRLVRLAQMLCGRGVVVVIENERRQVKRCNRAGDGRFASSAARESEIDLRSIERPAERGRIAVARTRCARSVRDGGTVEEDRFFNPVRSRRKQLRTRKHSDFNVLRRADQRHVDLKQTQLAVQIPRNGRFQMTVQQFRSTGDSDEMRIDSTVGVGTTVYMTVYTGG